MSVWSQIRIKDRHGNWMYVESDPDGLIVTSTAHAPGSEGGLPNVEIDETDQLKLRNWLNAVTS